jgi:hypothetical protein
MLPRMTVGPIGSEGASAGGIASSGLRRGLVTWAAVAVLAGILLPGIAAADGGLMIDGAIVDGTMVLPLGSRPTISWSGADARRVQVSPVEGGIRWYDGPASDMRLEPWLLRSGTITLVASFAGDAGASAETCRYTLHVEPGDMGSMLLPGLVAKVIRLDGSLAALPKLKDFAPRFRSLAASVPSRPEYASYPPYRTAESVEPPRSEVGDPAFQLPDFWQLPVAGPNGAEPETVVGVRPWEHPACPFGDLESAVPAAVLLQGFLMIPAAGSHAFKVESTLPFGLKVGDRSMHHAPEHAADLAHAEARVRERDPKTRAQMLHAAWPVHVKQLDLECGPGIVPFTMILSRRDTAAPARWRISWKAPGAESFIPIPSARFVHAVQPEAAAAYRAFRPAGSGWAATVKKTGAAADDGLAALIDSLRPSEHVTNDAAYDAVCARLLQACAHDPGWRGSPEVAARLLELIRGRFAHLRGQPEQLVPKHSFGKVRGDLLQHAVTLRPFVDACIEHPILQAAALEAHVEIARLAGIVFKRPFLTEFHQGTNDGYGDADNFLVNAWRAADACGDPRAWDAARSLFDNHFHYGGEGLHPDGVFSFHCANGRHVNMGGYGDDWIARVLNADRFGTPWGNTQEQYRRLVEWALAYEWFFYKGAAAFTTYGRHNSHRGACSPSPARRLLALPADAISADSRGKLDALLARIEAGQPVVGNRFFYRHLQMMHRRNDFHIDVKMNSPLVGGIETFAGAHPGNLSFGDGVTTLLRHGDEYLALHAPYDLTESLWRYRSLPGTTQANVESANPDGLNNPDRYRSGAGSRAGGVSDGDSGHCGFEFVHGTRARKLFAFTEAGMVVLGADIAGDKTLPDGDYSYRSNLNQCVLQGEVTVTDERGEVTVLEGDAVAQEKSFALDRRYWIEHHGIGYLVLPTGAERDIGTPGTLVLRTSLRTPLSRLPAAIMEAPAMAPYRDRCQRAAAKSPPREARVLELWIDHGAKPPRAARCAYFVCMRPETRPAVEWLTAPGFEILANTRGVQAVQDVAAEVVHAFFYEPGEIAGIAVKRPASAMLRRRAEGGAVLTVQDPVAACSRDAGAMTNVLEGSVGGESFSIPMPGGCDPDDRYRGGTAQIVVAAPGSER